MRVGDCTVSLSGSRSMFVDYMGTVGTEGGLLFFQREAQKLYQLMAPVFWNKFFMLPFSKALNSLQPRIVSIPGRGYIIFEPDIYIGFHLATAETALAFPDCNLSPPTLILYYKKLLLGRDILLPILKLSLLTSLLTRPRSKIRPRRHRNKQRRDR